MVILTLKVLSRIVADNFLIIPRHIIVAGYYGFTLDIRVSVRPSVVRPSINFFFPDDNLSKHQWIFTKLGMCIVIEEIWFGIANGQISSNFSPASVAQLYAPSDWRPGGLGFNPRQGQQHSFVEIDREIFSTVILSLPLIQEGQLSVSGERMCTILVNRLED